MKRYLNSFLITSLLYLTLGAVFIFAIQDIKIETKKEETITKISLNNVALEQPIVEEIVENIVEPIPEPIIEKIVEKPAPKVIEKPKIVKKKIEKKKPIEKIVEKPVEKIEKVVETEQKVSDNIQALNKLAEVQTSQITNNQQTTIENDYLAKVKAIIEKNKVYPKVAKRLHQTGKVVVAFDILKDGKVINIKIVENSKFEKLDSASIELLAKIGFFEAIPNELNRAVWNLTIPIHYQIN